MERLDLSFGEVVNTQGVRVQALRGGSNSPTSRCPEAVDWIICVRVIGVRTLLPVEGVAYIECARTPASPRSREFNVHKGQALLVTPYIKCHHDHKDYLITDRLDTE